MFETDELLDDSVHNAHKELSDDVAFADEIDSSLVSLEALADILSNTSTLSVEQMTIANILMRQAGAVAGADATTIMPGLESYLGTAPSLESLQDTIMKYLKEFGAFVMKIYNSIKAFLVRFFDDIGKLQDKFQNLLIAIDAKRDAKPNNPTAMVGASVHRLAVEYKVPKTYADLLQPLGELRAVTDSILDVHASNISKLSDTITKTASVSEDSLVSLIRVNRIAELFLKQIDVIFPKAAPVDGYTKATAPLFNNTAIMVNSPEVKQPKESTVENEVEISNIIRSTKFKVESTDDGSVVMDYQNDAKKREGSLYMDALTHAQLSPLCRNALDIIKSMVEFRSGYEKALKKQAEDSKRAAAAIAAVADGRAKFSSDGKSRITSVPALRAQMGYHGAIAKWSTEPFTGLLMYNVSVLNSLHNVLKNQLANLG